MPVLHNQGGQAVPIREQRSITGELGALNAELVLPLNGDASALVFVGSAAFVGTLEFSGLMDGVSGYAPVVAFPLATACAGGTIPLSGQPLLADALVAANTQRVYAVPVGQLRSLRVRASAYTSGAATLTIQSDTNDSINTAIASRPTTLMVTATAATGVAVTATLPSVANLRHVVDFIAVTRSATALLTAGATPTVVTTTNLPGAPAMTFGASADAQGVDREVRLEFGNTGLAATALGTNTTVVCPATTNVIWRANVAYRLGL